VYAAGGEPLVVHPVAPGAVVDPDAVGERLAFADAVLLPGGGDLAARWSGQVSHASLYDVDEEQDAFDLAVARWSLAAGKPLLAVCRGHQVVNVALGGDLVQDLGEGHRHTVRDVRIEAGSPFADVVGAATTVSCYHHMAVGRLGEGLRPVAWSSDGVVEAVTLDGHEGWYLGVQWHPEDTAATDPAQAAIFRALVEAARCADVVPA
jgi:putative glutamine amidotransferase